MPPRHVALSTHQTPDADSAVDIEHFKYMICDALCSRAKRRRVTLGRHRRSCAGVVEILRTARKTASRAIETRRQIRSACGGQLRTPQCTHGLGPARLADLTI
jgi:protein subunit release factor B